MMKIRRTFQKGSQIQVGRSCISYFIQQIKYLYVYFSFQSTPSEFDKSLVEKFRPLDEKKLLDRIFHFLDELDADFVFSSNLQLKKFCMLYFYVIDFEELEVCQFFWVSKMCLKKFDAIEIVAVLNKIGKRFLIIFSILKSILYFIQDDILFR